LSNQFDALILADARLDKQAVFNAEKVAHKICGENKNCLEAFLDINISVGDTVTLAQRYRMCKDDKERKAFIATVMISLI